MGTINNYKVISYYTPKYDGYAQSLIVDLDKFGIPHDIEPYPDQGSYVKNLLLKPLHIQKMLTASIGTDRPDVLWLDVDGHVHGKFDYLDNDFKGDVGAVMFKDNMYGIRSNPQIIPYPTMCTATMYLRNTENVRMLVATWVDKLDKIPPSDDAVSVVQYDWNLVFRGFAESLGVIFEELPAEYCYVLANEIPIVKINKEPIITQHNASLTMRDA